ncbi:MAG: hypothetical protein H7124_01245 [Phycisphaerales bacterium]|nr:hypothetical protein [Hyphomonadaceae bacterium]
MFALALAVAPAVLAACATSATVSDAPVALGTMREFAAPYSEVSAAALEAVERLNVDVQGSDETPERFQVRFSKPISGFSWGEVGVVNVVRVDEQRTRVYVNTARRHQGQVSGTSERQFSEQIFTNVSESIARLQP